MCSKIIYLVGLYLVTYSHCEIISNATSNDPITSSLAYSLQGIAKALLIHSHRLPKPKPKGDKCFSPCPLSASCDSPSPLPTSCEEIKTKWPGSISGYYHIGANKSSPTYVYCHMGELCGTEGGWTRLAYLDMSDSPDCPTGFRLYQSNGVRACGRATSNVGSCQSVQFPSNGVSYSQVCGRVVGYQFVSPSGVDAGITDINTYYLDGISITHGSPRKHIWSFLAGLQESEGYGNKFNCPCSNGSTQTIVQSFIGSDYFCESGNAQGGFQAGKLFTQDPLWDGKGCNGLEVNCCSAPGLPWFNKILNTSTTDYIELRVCADQSTSDEDAPVVQYEIYVK